MNGSGDASFDRYLQLATDLSQATDKLCVVRGRSFNLEINVQSAYLGSKPG